MRSRWWRAAFALAAVFIWLGVVLNFSDVIGQGQFTWRDFRQVTAQVVGGSAFTWGALKWPFDSGHTPTRQRGTTSPTWKFFTGLIGVIVLSVVMAALWAWFHDLPGPGALAPNPSSFVIVAFVGCLVAMMAACWSSEGFDRRGCAAAVAGTVLGSAPVAAALIGFGWL